MTVSPFASLADSADALDEVAVALLIDELLNPTLDSSDTRGQLAALLEPLSDYRDPWTGLAALGFAGNASDYNTPDNSSLSWVLENKRGIPISLAVLVIACVRGVGGQAVGLNQPGHFLVRVSSLAENVAELSPIIVDPFALQVVASETAARAAADAPIATPRDLALRMLNNLKYQQVQLGQWHLALNFLDHQRAVLPGADELRLEAAMYWEKLGSTTAALDIYTELLQRLNQGPLHAQAQVRYLALQKQKPEPLH